MDLNGKVAVVTGASTGIGSAYALALAQQGVTVIAAARTLGDNSSGTPAPDSLADVVQNGKGLPGRIYALPCDMECEEDIRRMIEQTVASFGTIDILVNNAAQVATFDPLQVSSDDWDRMMRVNLRGPYLAMRYAAPHMMRQRSGSIVNITARSASFVPKSPTFNGTLVYGVTKAGLNRLSFGMSEELKDFGIAVNALGPGVIATTNALRKRPNMKEYGALDPTPDVLGPALLYVLQQTPETMTGQVVYTEEFGKTWGPGVA